MLKILLIFVLIGIFIFVSWFSKVIHDTKIKKERISGKRAYTVSAEQQETIDDFDNIACDGLLICQNYIFKYNQSREQYIKDNVFTAGNCQAERTDTGYPVKDFRCRPHA